MKFKIGDKVRNKPLAWCKFNGVVESIRQSRVAPYRIKLSGVGIMNSGYEYRSARDMELVTDGLPNPTPKPNIDFDMKYELLKLQTPSGNYVISSLGVNDREQMETLLAYINRKLEEELENLNKEANDQFSGIPINAELWIKRYIKKRTEQLRKVIK